MEASKAREAPENIAVMPTSAAGIELVRKAERLGVDSVWVPEFWAADALTPLAFLAAWTSTIRLATGIVQLGARTPAMLAMSAMSLQALSGGRFGLGIGTSGPQVMEGWHGVRFDKPVRRTRETIDIIRAVSAGRRLEYDGEIYKLELDGKIVGKFGRAGKLTKEFGTVNSIDCRSENELYVGEIGNWRVQKLTLH